jgi:dolichol-phosphate mannosyltransferase
MLPVMLEFLKSRSYDLVVGSRYVDGGSLGDSNSSRARISRLATLLNRLICGRDIADPMSGFFMMNREMFESAM